MSKQGLVIVKIGTPGAAAIVADQSAGIVDVNGRNGWAFIKDGMSPAADKINWYMWSGQYENVQLKHMKSLFILGSIDTWTNVDNESFFIVVHTKMTGSGDAGTWFHSRHAYLMDRPNHTVQAGERCLFHALEAPTLTFEGARHIPLEKRIDTGVFDPESEILAISVHTDSAAPAVNVLVESMGVDWLQHQYHTDERTVNVNLTT